MKDALNNRHPLVGQNLILPRTSVFRQIDGVRSRKGQASSDAPHRILCDEESLCWIVAVPDCARDDTHDHDAADTGAYRRKTFYGPVCCGVTPGLQEP
jgi:hypothetical protein